MCCFALAYKNHDIKKLTAPPQSSNSKGFVCWLAASRAVAWVRWALFLCRCLYFVAGFCTKADKQFIFLGDNGFFKRHIYKSSFQRHLGPWRVLICPVCLFKKIFFVLL